MKRILAGVLLAVFLTGCSAQKTMETISDVLDASATAKVQQVQLSLPEDAALATLENEDAGKLYLCDGYAVAVQTMQSGDLGRTFKQTTGFSREQLTVITTQKEGFTRYDCAWSAVGEGGDQTCRGVVLDDGYYHYVITVMADADMAGQLASDWQRLLDSATLVSTD